MMLKFGSGAVSAAYLGDAELSAAYLGGELLWQRCGNPPPSVPTPGNPIALFHCDGNWYDETGNFEAGVVGEFYHAQPPPARFGTGVKCLMNVYAHSPHSSEPGVEAITGTGSESFDAEIYRTNGSVLLPLEFTAFTLECWLRPVLFIAANNNVGIDGASGQCHVGLCFKNGSDGTKTYSGITFGASAGRSVPDLTGNSDVSEERWYHLAYVFDGTDMSLYVDGTLWHQETDAPLAGMLSGGTFYQVGWHCSAAISGTVDSEFAIAIDEVALFDYARYAGNFTPPTEPYSLT